MVLTVDVSANLYMTETSIPDSGSPFPKRFRYLLYLLTIAIHVPIPKLGGYSGSGVSMDENGGERTSVDSVDP